MSFSDVKDKIDALSGSLVDQMADFTKVREYINKIIQLEREIQTYIRHIHKSHAHPFLEGSHKHDLVNTPPGGLSTNCRIFNPIDYLIMEAYSIEDMDNNGKIYGKDFIIDPKDPNKPPSLISAEENLRMYYNTSLPYEDCVERFGTLLGQGEVISFNDYLKEMHWEQRPCAESLEGQLVQQLMLGQNSCGQSEVYGHTFIIDPGDPNKPEFLKELEGPIPPKKIISWKKFLESKGITDSTPDHQPAVQQCDYVCTRLLGEWLHGVDIDGNGLIYGTDFFLEKNDPQKCRCLIEIESDVDWQPPENIKLFTWDEFCNTFPNKNPDDRGDMDDE